MSDEARHAFVVSIFLFAVLFVLVVVTALRTKTTASASVSSKALSAAVTAHGKEPALRPVKVTTTPLVAPPTPSSAPAASAPAENASAPVPVASSASPQGAPPPADLASAISKFEPYAARARDAQTQTQFSAAIKQFSKTLTPAERVVYGRFVAEDEHQTLPIDRLRLLIALIQGPLPAGRERNELDEVLRNVGRSAAKSAQTPGAGDAPPVGQGTVSTPEQQL